MVNTSIHGEQEFPVPEIRLLRDFVAAGFFLHIEEVALIKLRSAAFNPYKGRRPGAGRSPAVGGSRRRKPVDIPVFNHLESIVEIGPDKAGPVVFDHFLQGKIRVGSDPFPHDRIREGKNSDPGAVRLSGTEYVGRHTLNAHIGCKYFVSNLGSPCKMRPFAVTGQLDNVDLRLFYDLG